MYECLGAAHSSLEHLLMSFESHQHNLNISTMNKTSVYLLWLKVSILWLIKVLDQHCLTVCYLSELFEGKAQTIRGRDSGPGRESTHNRYICSRPHRASPQPCPVKI
jgi:hypothetical protein